MVVFVMLESLVSQWLHSNTTYECVCACACVYVCMSAALILALRATRRLKGNTNVFSSTLADLLTSDFHDFAAFKSYSVKHKRKSQYPNEYCLSPTGLCRFAHCGSIRSFSNVKP